jgi:hypothetical protein
MLETKKYMVECTDAICKFACMSYSLHRAERYAEMHALLGPGHECVVFNKEYMEVIKVLHDGGDLEDLTRG